MVEVIAEGKNLRISPKKVRPVAENLRGKKAEDVLETLRFVQKKAATPISKVLKSALANAKQNKNMSTSGLVIKEVIVNEGPMYKRYRPVSRGAVHHILKRTSHIKVVLEEKTKE
ncbi:MAG: 50S ribosomal protein L22 [Candidatus Woykebacteria bacterium]